MDDWVSSPTSLTIVARLILLSIYSTIRVWSFTSDCSDRLTLTLTSVYSHFWQQWATKHHFLILKHLLSEFCLSAKKQFIYVVHFRMLQMVCDFIKSNEEDSTDHCKHTCSHTVMQSTFNFCVCCTSLWRAKKAAFSLASFSDWHCGPWTINPLDSLTWHTTRLCKTKNNVSAKFEEIVTKHLRKKCIYVNENQQHQSVCNIV